MQVEIYADGCYSHEYRAGGVGWCLVGFEDEEIPTGYLALKIPGATYETEFLASFHAVKAAVERYGARTLRMDLTLFTDNNQTFDSLGKRLVPNALKNQCGGFYDLLDSNFRSWERGEAHKKTSIHLELADDLSHVGMYERRAAVIKAAGNVLPTKFESRMELRKRRVEELNMLKRSY